VTTANNGAYKRFVYGPAYVYSYASVNNVADEAFAISYLDGMGRAFATSVNHPGSSTGYSGQYIYFDQMGRVVKQDNPTEINSAWVPSGDDAAGWYYTQQTYDWKGRPLITTNQDGTQKIASYSACGCAGSEVTTLTDEMGRRQNVYSDVLGRTVKSEVLNTNGTVYSATVTEYNARDQVTATKSYKGAATSDSSCPSGTCMQSVTTYDGYGRVATQKLPQQTTATSYAYNPDDTVLSVTDPRGVVASNTYNNRHLLTSVSWPAVSPALVSVSFGYDAAGNRTGMLDGTGSISYAYDQLSHMTSETRNFNFPDFNHTYTISYGYNLSGLLTSVTDPTNAQVSYNYDQAGRLTSMPATGYTGVTQFLSNEQYRAFGGMKHATLGNSVQADLTYNSRMQIGQYQASGFHDPNTGAPYNMGATMSYYADGRTNTAFDLNDAKFDRKYDFDLSARLSEAYSGVEAHGQPAPPLNQANSPYRQSYTYDEWNNVLSRSGRVWTRPDGETGAYTSDNKRQGWTYDAAGNALTTFDGPYTYDVASRPVSFVSFQTWKVYPDWPADPPDGPALETHDTFDGTGQMVKHINTTREDASWVDDYGIVHYWPGGSTTTTYYVHSTVLGGKTIAEVNSNGGVGDRFVYAGGSRIATYHWAGGYTEIELANPITGASVTTDATGSYSTRKEPDPIGRDLTDPIAPLPPPNAFSSELMKDRAMPIEAPDYNWSDPIYGSFLDEGMGIYVNTMDMINARDAFTNWLKSEKTSNIDYNTWQNTLNNNPNVGVIAGQETYWGKDGTDFLNRNADFISLGAAGIMFKPQNPAPNPVTQGIDQARQALQQNTLCRALFGGANPLTLLNTYASNGLISSGTTYPVAQPGGGTRQQNFGSGDVGAVTSYAAGSYPSPTAPGVRISANPITINQNGFYFSGNNSAGVAVNTLQGAGFQGLSLGQIRGAVIIHELLHVVSRIPGDSGNPTQSRANSELVRHFCFSNTPVSTTTTPLATLH